MKAWLWRLLYPMNVWSRFVVYCGSLIKLYNKWIWVPFLDKLLSNNLKAVRDRGAYSTSHICVHCGKRVKLALITYWDKKTNIFCSVGCKDKWEEPDLTGEESEFLPQSFVWICGDYMKSIKKLALSILTYCIMTTNLYAASGATILSDTNTFIMIVLFLLALVGLPRR